MSKKLTAKQQAFVDAYAGNGTQAARAAGYTGSDATLAVTASDLLRNPNVASAIQKRQAPKKKGLIASREERQAFWTRVMRSKSFEPRDRLKAAELLGKSEADFTEKVKHEGALPIHVVDPYAKPKE